MKRAIRLAAVATALGSLMACSGSSPAAPAPAANIAGQYNATVTASAACSANLPSETRVLSAAAEVSQTGGTAQVKFNPHGGSVVTVAGTVSGQTVNFPSLSLNATTPGGAVSVVATASKANVAANGEITAALSGTYQAAVGTSCNAGDHQLQMRRCVVTCAGNVCACQ